MHNHKEINLNQKDKINTKASSASNDVRVSTLNLHQSTEERTMTNRNHFADLLDARDGVHPNRGTRSVLEPTTDEPDQEYLDILNEDVFGSLIAEGHGVRVHKTDKPWMGKLDLNPDNCNHRMISELDLFGDYWEPALERPQEDLTPIEAGPWEDEYMDEFCDWNVIEYQIATHEDEYYDETWDILKDSHLDEQSGLFGMEHSFNNAIRVSELSDAKAKRLARFESILVWCSTVEFKKLQAQKGRLWYKINTSRKLAGENNRWGWVYLTKVQVDAINEVIQFRMGEYHDSFK